VVFPRVIIIHDRLVSEVDSVWHSGFKVVASDNIPFFFHVEVATMLSKICKSRRRSQLHRRYQHIGFCNTHEEKSEQCWLVKLNYVSMVDQLLVVWKHIVAVPSESMIVFPNLNLLRDGVLCAVFCRPDQRSLYE
jgi:hypothetical protein